MNYTHYYTIIYYDSYASSNPKENAQLCISIITEIKETPVYF